MKTILIFGAGQSSTALIKYLLDLSGEHDWTVVLGDLSGDLAGRKIDGHPRGRAVGLNVGDSKQRKNLIKDADVVISMLPPDMHDKVARSCLELSRHFLSASYVSNKIRAMDQEARQKGLLFLNEMGVDPGIDHMSAMRIIDRIKGCGGRISAFESATGGLVAPESDNNPWNYKFTWNPRNVVVAGQGVSKFLHHGRMKYIPYHRLFKRTETVSVLDIGAFEIYPNRDSLKYQSTYGLEGIRTMFRGTLRRSGYSEAWDVFVQLGLTDDSYVIENSESITFRDFLDSYLAYSKNLSVETKLARYMNLPEDSKIMEKIRWSGILERRKIGLKRATPARILQHLIEPKWQLAADEKDMIVMRHLFEYELDDIEKRLISTLVIKGTDKNRTAMATTVGLPVAIASKLLLTKRILARGVHLPVIPEIYIPVLDEMESYGVRFVEKEELIQD
jgi:saccharopine dehydrogenase-like NADP-dependent oxidoreductase